MARRSNNSNVMWFVTGMLVVILIIGLYYLQQHGNSVPQTSDIKKHKTEAAKDKNTKPQFDFYSELSKQTTPSTPSPLPAPTKKITTPTTKKLPSIPAPSKTTHHSAPTAALPAPKKVTPTYFYLQITALRNYDDADKIKAELILEGYDANIERININHINYNRVILGPYNSLEKAKADQTKLLKHNLKTLLVGEKTKPQ